MRPVVDQEELRFMMTMVEDFYHSSIFEQKVQDILVSELCLWSSWTMLSIKSSQSARLNHGPAGTEMKRTVPMQFCDDDANEKIY